MDKVLKIAYWTSIFLPCFWILTAILGTFIPLEFADNNNEFIYDSIRFYGFPIAILLTLTGTIKKADATSSVATKIFLTIGVAAFSVFVMVMTLFAGMCDWTTDKVFFENIKNPSVKIVQRDFGGCICAAGC